MYRRVSCKVHLSQQKFGIGDNGTSTSPLARQRSGHRRRFRVRLVAAGSVVDDLLAGANGMSQLHLRLVTGRSPVSSFCFDSSGSKVTLSCGITFSLPSRQCRMGLRRDLGNGLWTLSGGLS